MIASSSEKFSDFIELWFFWEVGKNLSKYPQNQTPISIGAFLFCQRWSLRK